MFIHNINPILLQLGPFQIRYYGIIFAFGFILASLFLHHFIKRRRLHMHEKDLETYMIYIILGVVLGARLFEILFYNLPFYIQYPREIIAIWHGGLSFHGGLVGAIAATWIFCKKRQLKFLNVADYLVLPAALALALGRIGNFLNGELWGRVTSVSWAVKFQGAEGFRHPSQLYESAKNVFIFFVLLWHVEKRQHRDGFLFGVFLTLYGLLRFLVEFIREPGVMVGPLTMGQLLSIPVFCLGVYLIIKKRE